MPTIPVSRLTDLTVGVLTASGATRESAGVVADSLVGADRAGHGSHGVLKLPSYVRDIRAGKLDPLATPTVVGSTAATARIDGEGGFGHLAARAAADLAVRNARGTGLGAVAVSHAHHTGRLGGWSERIAAQGMIGMLAGAEGQPPYKVVPHGGRAGALATNPVSWAVPRGPGRPPVLLDFATSMISIGKLQLARTGDESVPPGSVLDAEGRPAADVEAFFDGGFLSSFGSYKGYSLGVVAELLALGLSDGQRFGGAVRSSCLFVLAIDPAPFRPLADFFAHVGRIGDRIKATPAADGSEVLLPGDPEERTRAKGGDHVTVADATWQALRRLGADVGVSALADS